MNSFVPQPIPQSAAESKAMGIGTGALACAYTQKAVSDLLFNNPNKPWTVPFLLDSQAAIAMNNSEQPTKRNKHIDKRYFFGRQEKVAGNVEYIYINAHYCLPDIATKNLSYEEARKKLSYIEYPVSDEAIGPKAYTRSPKEILSRLYRSNKGDENDELLVTDTDTGDWIFQFMWVADELSTWNSAMNPSQTWISNQDPLESEHIDKDQPIQLRFNSNSLTISRFTPRNHWQCWTAVILMEA